MITAGESSFTTAAFSETSVSAAFVVISFSSAESSSSLELISLYKSYMTASLYSSSRVMEPFGVVGGFFSTCSALSDISN